MKRYWEIKKLLEENPIIESELEKLRYLTGFLSEDFSMEEFKIRCEEYQDFVRWLIEIVELPKNKFKVNNRYS